MSYNVTLAKLEELEAGAALIFMTNNTGGNLEDGDVVVLDTSTDNNVIFATSDGDSRVLGVVVDSGTVANGDTVKVNTAGVAEVKVTAAISRGDLLVADGSNNGEAKVSTTPGAGLLGKALEEYAGGPQTTIAVLLTPNAAGSDLNAAYDGGRTITADAGPIVLNSSTTTGGTLDINPSLITETSPQIDITFAAGTYTVTPDGIRIDMTSMTGLSSGSDVSGVDLRGKTNAGAGDSIGLKLDANWDVGIENAGSLDQQGDAIFGGTVRLDEQGGSPSNIANTGFVYTLDSGGATELYYLDDSGNAVQLTSAGSVNAGGSSDLQGAYANGNTITTSVANGDVTITGDQELIVAGTVAVTFSTSGLIRQTGSGQVTFAGNVDADAGLDVSGGALTVANQAITQTTGGQVTFAGNVDATGGLDVTGGALTVANQAITQSGSGQVTFTGNVDATSGLDVSGGAITGTAGIALSGGNLDMPGLDIGGVSDEIGDMYSGSGIRFGETTTPVNAANKGWVYTKDAGGATELHYLDDSGNEIQLTNAGALNLGAIGATLDDAYDGGRTITADAGPVVINQSTTSGGSLSVVPSLTTETSPQISIAWSAGAYTGTPYGVSVDYSGMTSLSNAADVVGVRLLGELNAGVGDSVAISIDGNWDQGIENAGSFIQSGDSILTGDFTHGAGSGDIDVSWDFSGGVSNSAGEFLISGGNFQLNDSVVLSVGTGDDFTLSHNGTDTFLTSATGDLVVDNTAVDKDVIVRLGTDTVATGFEVQNNSETAVARIDPSAITLSVSTTAAGGSNLAVSGGGTLSSDGGLTLTNTGITMTGLDLGGSAAEVGDLYTDGYIRFGEIATPTNVANKGFLYSKDSGGATELFYLDDSGNEVQLTASGVVVGDTLTTYHRYVSTSGSVAGVGSQQDPFDSIQDAIDSFPAPSDQASEEAMYILHIEGGYYTDTMTFPTRFQRWVVLLYGFVSLTGNVQFVWGAPSHGASGGPILSISGLDDTGGALSVNGSVQFGNNSSGVGASLTWRKPVVLGSITEHAGGMTGGNTGVVLTGTSFISGNITLPDVSLESQGTSISGNLTLRRWVASRYDQVDGNVTVSVAPTDASASGHSIILGSYLGGDWTGPVGSARFDGLTAKRFAGVYSGGAGESDWIDRPVPDHITSDGVLISGTGEIKLNDDLQLVLGTDDDVALYFASAAGNPGAVPAADSTLWFLGMRQQIGRVTGDPIALRQTTYENALQAEVEMDTGGAAEEVEAIDGLIDNSGGVALTTGSMAAFQARLTGNAADAGTSEYVGIRMDDTTDSGGSAVFKGIRVGSGYDLAMEVTSGDVKLNDTLSVILGTDDDVTMEFTPAGGGKGPTNTMTITPAAQPMIIGIGGQTVLETPTGTPFGLTSTNRFALEANGEASIGTTGLRVFSSEANNSSGTALSGSGFLSGYRARLIGNASDAASTEYIAFEADDFISSGGSSDSIGLYVGTDYDLAVDAESGDLYIRDGIGFFGDPLGLTAPVSISTSTGVLTAEVQAGSATADMKSIRAVVYNIGTALTTGSMTGLNVEVEGNALDGAGSEYLGIEIQGFASGGGSAASTGIRIENGYDVGVEVNDPVHVEGAALRFGETATPTNVTDKGFVYTKDDSGDTELYYLDAAGNEIQLTADGGVKNALLADVLAPGTISGGTVSDGGGGTVDVASGDHIINGVKVTVGAQSGISISDGDNFIYLDVSNSNTATRAADLTGLADTDVLLAYVQGSGGGTVVDFVIDLRQISTQVNRHTEILVGDPFSTYLDKSVHFATIEEGLNFIGYLSQFTFRYWKVKVVGSTTETNTPIQIPIPVTPRPGILIEGNHHYFSSLTPIVTSWAGNTALFDLNGANGISFRNLRVENTSGTSGASIDRVVFENSAASTSSRIRIENVRASGTNLHGFIHCAAADNGISHSDIVNCEVSCTDFGVFLDQSDSSNVSITDCTFNQSGTQQSSLSVGVSLGSTVAIGERCKVRGNTFIDFDDGVISISGRTTITENLIDNADTGITVGSSSLASNKQYVAGNRVDMGTSDGASATRICILVESDYNQVIGNEMELEDADATASVRVALDVQGDRNNVVGNSTDITGGPNAATKFGLRLGGTKITASANQTNGAGQSLGTGNTTDGSNADDA